MNDKTREVLELAEVYTLVADVPADLKDTLVLCCAKGWVKIRPIFALVDLWPKGKNPFPGSPVSLTPLWGTHAGPFRLVLQDEGRALLIEDRLAKTADLPTDGKKYTEDTLPAEYRDGARKDGEPLTAKYLKEEWQITGSDLSKYRAKNVITHSVLLGRQFVYLLTEVEKLRDIKTDRTDKRH